MQAAVPILVFADDWGRHPSSAQHLMRYRPTGYELHWVNTIGTRPPRWDLSTARRAWGKVRGWLTPRRGAASERQPRNTNRAAPVVQANAPIVHQPLMWPSFGSKWSRRLNQACLLRALRPIVESLPMPPIVFTTLPLTADLVGRLPAQRWIYYCVDDFSCWPGYDGATMARMERDLAPACEVAIAVSTTLQEHLKAFGHDAPLLTHGVDLKFWQAPAQEPPLLSLLTTGDMPSKSGWNAGERLSQLPRPWILFWGVIDRRMDTEFVQQLSQNLGHGSLIFLGPEEDPDPAWLTGANVHRFGPQPFESLPQWAAAADVLMMPYIDAPVTRAMQPLKLKEFLATGRPVVVRDLPAVEPWRDGLDACSQPMAFADAVLKRVRTGLPPEQQQARERLTQESWSAKAEQLFRWALGPSTRVRP